MPTLVVEDGSIVTGANSYASVDDADNYFDGHPDLETWAGASDDRKTWALYRAARQLEARYSGRWRGGPVGTVASLGLGGISQLQNLSWPRVIFSDYGFLYGAYLGTFVIPQQVIEAQCELALRDIKDGSLDPDQDRESFIASKSESFGPISETTTYTQSAPARTRFPEIDVILAPLLESGGNTRPIVRG